MFLKTLPHVRRSEMALLECPGHPILRRLINIFRTFADKLRMLRKDQNKTVFSKLVQISLTVALAACTNQVVEKAGRPSGLRNSSNGQCPKILNGIVVDNVRAVVHLKIKLQDGSTSECTGTFLGDNAVLTASHCTENTANGSVELADGTKAVAMVEGWTVEDKKEDQAAYENEIGTELSYAQYFDRKSRDIAVLIFPSGTSSSWRNIAPNPPKVGDTIMIAGYGRTSFQNDSADGNVRYGSNSIDFLKDGLLIFESAAGTHPTAGQDSTSSFGDSGGPVLYKEGVVGVISAGDTTQAIYAYLFSEFNLKVLEEAEGKGARINGLNSVRKALDRPAKPETSDPTDGCSRN